MEYQLNDAITDQNDSTDELYAHAEEPTIDERADCIRQQTAQLFGNYENGSMGHAVLAVAEAIMISAEMVRQGLGWVSTSIDNMIADKEEGPSEVLEGDDFGDPEDEDEDLEDEDLLGEGEHADEGD